MLVSLHIENIAVAKTVDISFEKGFTVLTGETGAGKSIIIDSIGLILGERWQKEWIRSGEEHASVSAIFDNISSFHLERLTQLGIEPDEDGLLYLQRTIYKDGKSKTLINGRQIPVSLQKEICSGMIAIHGQHANQALLTSSKHIAFLDMFAEDGTQLASYRMLYNKMKEIEDRICELKEQEKDRNRLVEIMKYQLADIDSVKLKKDEEEKLLEQRKIYSSSEKIARNVSVIRKTLYQSDKGLSAVDAMDRARTAFLQLEGILPEAGAYAEKLESFRYELIDMAETAWDYTADLEEDIPAVLDRIETRLDAIEKLKMKYGETIEDVLRFRKETAEKLEEMLHSEDTCKQLEKQRKELEEKAKQEAKILSQIRRNAANELERKIMQELCDLDMNKVQFKIDFQDTEGTLTKNGIEEVEFLLSTNAGDTPMSLDRIASGGELSRIMLAMKSVFADKEGTDTIIYDEIDTGISGSTSQKIGIKLKKAAKNSQIICVTHSAQIASVADEHMRVTKKEKDGRVESSVESLDFEGRIQETARIMGGMEITEGLLSTAREMIELASGY